MAQNVENTT